MGSTAADPPLIVSAVFRVLAALCCLAPAATGAAAVAGPTPLAVASDPLGAELQSTMIWTGGDAPAESRFVAFRRGFELAAAPAAATLHVFADARYMLWVNGVYVTGGPARFDPAGPEYDTLEIGRHLRAGPNSLALLVLAHTGPAQSGRIRRHAPGLTLQLEVDGHRKLATDTGWRWSERTRYRPPLIDWANLTDRIDTRIEDGDWTQTAYDDRAWAPAVAVPGDLWGPLTARRTPRLRDTPAIYSFTGPTRLPVTLAAGERLAFTLPRLSQVYTVLDFTAEDGAGAEFALDYASATLERLDGNDHGFGGITCRVRAGRQVYITSDSRGLAEGAIVVTSGRITVHALSLVERLYPFDVAGRFHSSDPRLDRLWALCARSAQVLSEDAYVDCADRERVEWMDCDPPAFDVTRTALAGPPATPGGPPRCVGARLLGALLRRTALTVQPDGWVKAHTASDRFDLHAKMEDRACDWVQGARRYLDSTGDLALIREIWPVIVRQMDWFLARRTPRGLVLAREWIVWGNPVGYVTCEGAGLNAFVYRALRDAAHLGRAVGDTAAADHFDRAAGDLAAAFDRVLWDEHAGNYASAYFPEATRTLPENREHPPKLALAGDRLAPSFFSALWALDQGIVPPEKQARVRDFLLRHRRDAERIMTFYYLFKQLYAADTPELDRAVLDTLRTKWAAMTASPWQASWEEFAGASKAHIYGMFPGYFLSACVLGVRPEMPAARRHLVFEPRPADLTQADGVVVTEFGPVPVAWEVQTGRFAFQLEVPAGTTATLRVPAPAAGARLELDGRIVAARRDGRFLVTDVTGGSHRGAAPPEHRIIQHARTPAHRP